MVNSEVSHSDDGIPSPQLNPRSAINRDDNTEGEKATQKNRGWIVYMKNYFFS